MTCLLKGAARSRCSCERDRKCYLNGVDRIPAESDPRRLWNCIERHIYPHGNCLPNTFGRSVPLAGFLKKNLRTGRASIGRLWGRSSGRNAMCRSIALRSWRRRWNWISRICLRLYDLCGRAGLGIGSSGVLALWRSSRTGRGSLIRFSRRKGALRCRSPRLGLRRFPGNRERESRLKHHRLQDPRRSQCHGLLVPRRQ